VVSLLPLIYFFPATRGRLILAPDDGVIFNVPMRVVVANLIHSGYVPLWNPYMFSGMPLFGAAQAGVLFPLNWFYLIFSAPVATNLMMLSTYVFAALGAYLYARRSGATIAGAAMTSLIWQASAFMVAKVGQTNVVQTAAFLPWVLWVIDGYGRNGKRKDGVLLALLVALQIFAGHQQTFSYSFLLAGAYALVMARMSSGSERRSYAWSLVPLSAGVALAAVQILPTIELLRNSLRAAASYDFFSSFSMPPRFVLTFFAPFIMGGGDGALFRAPYIGPAFVGEYVAYVGSMTIMLALAALVLQPDARTRFWSVVAAICLALAIGRFLPFNFYKLVYYVPVINLFRVPARHLMEVEFALAVLAGRGLTAITGTQQRWKTLATVGLAAALVFLLTFLTVTWWRPKDFVLGRSGPVSLLRAPELFMPIVISAISVATVWFFARNIAQRPRRSLALLFTVLVFDLFLWGQSSGWRLSPTTAHPLWREPASVRMLRDLQKTRGNLPYRILTDVQPFFINTGRDEAEKFKLGEFMMSLQPDTYVMHGVDNAAGYDGFGLNRYSKLASDMKVWGELTDPERSVRGPGREFDILNVRYLIKQSPHGEAIRLAAERAPLATATQPFAPPELVTIGGLSFARGDLGAPSLIDGERLVFNAPPTDANKIGFISSLSWAADVKDGEIVGYLRLRTEDGKKLEFPIRAGEHTAEWSRDRRDLKTKILHRRAPVATSFPVEDPAGNYESHTYIATFSLPATARITGGEIEVATIKDAPRLTLDVKRVSLVGDGMTQPLQADWIEKLPARQKEDAAEEPSAALSLGEGRWKLATESEYLQIYENTNALPRAWLAAGELVASDEEALKIIHTGKLANGQDWNPQRTAIVALPTNQTFATTTFSGTADVTRQEPNRIEVTTQAAAPAILVLSENHYPGWNAYVDGVAVETLRVDYNLRGVVLGAGNHRVEFVYRPKSVLIGLAISLLTLAGLIAWWRIGAASEKRV
jgi:membrane protein YfhO